MNTHIEYTRRPTLVQWTLWDTDTNKVVHNGAENNLRKARKAAEHSQRMAANRQEKK